MAQSQPDKRRTWSTRKPLLIGGLGILILVSVLGLWASQVSISGAVIGKGRVEVSEINTAVQHPIGGVVSRIAVQDGDRVQAGDLLVQLDDQALRSDLATVEDELFEVLAGMARLEALIDEREELLLHPLLSEMAGEREEVALLVARQARLLQVQRENLATEARLLDEQTSQAFDQISGLEAELSTKVAHREILARELAQAKELSGKGLIKLSELTRLQKDDLRIESDIAALQAKIAELRSKITEFGLKRAALLPTAIEKASEELSRLRPQRTKFLERRARIMTELDQLEIRAPLSGRVYDIQLQGLRSVVVAARPLMFIVPVDAPVQVRVRIGATDVDQVFPGQGASLKFRAFNRRSTPVIMGLVESVSADAFLDPATKKPYYDVLVSLQPEELAKLGGQELIPGMPVDAFLTTQARTPLSYVLKPIMDYVDRAFRDA